MLNKNPVLPPPFNTGFAVIQGNVDRKVEQLYGPRPTDIDQMSMPMTICLYRAAFFWVADNGTALEILASLLSMFTLCTRLRDFAKSEPDFKESHLLVFFGNDEFQPWIGRDLIIQMIDKREDGLTEDQVNKLKDITARYVSLESLLFQSVFGKKWFEA